MGKRGGDAGRGDAWGDFGGTVGEEAGGGQNGRGWDDQSYVTINFPLFVVVRLDVVHRPFALDQIFQSRDKKKASSKKKTSRTNVKKDHRVAERDLQKLKRTG